MKKREVEILAPAGSIEGVYASLQMGADAVYVGARKFGARAFAKNPDVGELCEALRYAHVRKKKIYLTTNTLLSDSEFDELYDTVAPLYETGLDACIVQDVGVLAFLHENFPHMALHASTQMTLYSGEEAELYRSLGVTRYIPARELTIEEIRQARKQTDMEMEVFVHGALCYCYSGQCLMSEVIGGRSGNHGMCAQPCRLPLTTKYGKGHFLSMKDICTLPYIPQLVEAGVDSLKIEGRMKRTEYSAYIPRLYRKYVDYYQEKGGEAFSHLVENPNSELWEDYRACMDLYNRGGFTKGYLWEKDKKKLLDSVRNGHAGVRVGTVTAVSSHKVSFQTEEELHYQDVLEFRSPESGRAEYEYTVKDSAGRSETVTANYQKGCHLFVGQPVYRTKNAFLLKEIQTVMRQKEEEDTVFLCGKWVARVGQPVSFTAGREGIEVTVQGPVLEEARKRPVTEEDVRQRLEQMGDSGYGWQCLEIEQESGGFLPVGEIKRMRRDAVLAWEKEYIGQRSLLREPKKKVKRGKQRKPVILVGVSSLEQLRMALKTGEEVFLHLRLEDLSWDDWEELPTLLQNRQAAVSLPRVLRGEGYRRWLNLWQQKSDLWEKIKVSLVLINSHRSLLFARQFFPNAVCVAEDTLYQENEWAKCVYEEMGVGEVIRKNYGRTAVMISEGCVAASVKGCVKRKEYTEVATPKKDCFVAVNHCDLCYNTIYTKEPVEKRRNSGDIRLEFTWESEDEMRKVLRKWNLL